MAGAENLIPNGKRTQAELKTMGARGGRKSGETRRIKRTMQQVASALLKGTPKGRSAAIRKLEELGYDREAEGPPTVQALMISKAIVEALDGDWEAFRIVMDVAQVPGMKAKIEREKIKAQREGRKVTLELDPAEGAQIMAEVEARMAAEAVDGGAGPEDARDRQGGDGP